MIGFPSLFEAHIPAQVSATMEIPTHTRIPFIGRINTSKDRKIAFKYNKNVEVMIINSLLYY